EAVQGTLVGDQSGAQAGIPAVQVGEQVGDGIALALHRLRAAGVRAQDGRDTNLDCHDDVTPQDSDRDRLTTVSYYGVGGRTGRTLVVDGRLDLPEHVCRHRGRVDARVDHPDRLLLHRLLSCPLGHRPDPERAELVFVRFPGGHEQVVRVRI